MGTIRESEISTTTIGCVNVTPVAQAATLNGNSTTSTTDAAARNDAFKFNGLPVARTILLDNNSTTTDATGIPRSDSPHEATDPIIVSNISLV